MRINDIVYDMLVEEVKNKTLFNALMTKWRLEYPELTPEQGEEIYNKHSVIKPNITEDRPGVVTFLARHDGNHGFRKFNINDLKDITKFTLKEILDFLKTYSGFKMGGDVDGGEETPKVNVNKVFEENGNQPTESKIEASKAMWESDNAIINEDGFRVYSILNQTQVIRMGYYYQTIHKQAWLKYNRNTQYNTGVSAPWCVTWRGSDVTERDTEGNYLYGQGGNLYGNYRTRHQRTFYFVIDESRNPLSEDPKESKYYMSALQIDDSGSYRITSMFNDGDNTYSWQEVVAIYPKLANHRNLIGYREMSDEELESATITDTINEMLGSPNEFARQTDEVKEQYIDNGGTINTVKSWKSMSNELKTKYVDMMTVADAFTRVSSSELLNTIIATPGYLNKLDRKLKILGKSGIGYLVDDFMKNDYELVRTNVTNNKIRIYQNKRTKEYGIYDITKFNWVTVNGALLNDSFSEGKMIAAKDDEGTYYSIIPYHSSHNVTFYVVTDNPTLHGGGEAEGYFVSERTWEEKLSQKLLPIEGKKVKQMTDFEPESDTDIKEIKKGV